ncbi:hypothetical protein COLO4_06797 [Corchorus olitorius]|uniref:Uncharacterized protein n=1 Tax=Corchorus olitorius TaxID=93759 RepID=A0A1R3KLV7_9ROSI|nr:hypothetical protein COLO4_06797 [Corchorus olitorius]
MEGDHSCGVNLKNKQVKSKMIVEKLHESIRDNPKMTLKQIQKAIASQILVDVNLKRCARVKHKQPSHGLRLAISIVMINHCSVAM